MVSEMSNPLYRAGFEHAMDYSLRQILSNNPTLKNDARFIAEREKANDERTIHYEPPRSRLRRTHRQIDRYEYSNENIFGKVCVQSTTLIKQSINDHEDEIWDSQLYEHKMNIRIQPAWWLIKIGFNRGLRVAISQATDRCLNIALNRIRLVPDDALIFDFCATNNIDGVRRLLMRGEATARDTTSWGQTPLHVSTR